MNKIVREHYPVEKLPDDLRRLLPKAREVKLEITVPDTPGLPEGQRTSGAETAELIRKLREKNTRPARTMAEIVSEVRELRDEWDD